MRLQASQLASWWAALFGSAYFTLLRTNMEQTYNIKYKRFDSFINRLSSITENTQRLANSAHEAEAKLRIQYPGCLVIECTLGYITGRNVGATY